MIPLRCDERSDGTLDALSLAHSRQRGITAHYRRFTVQRLDFLDITFQPCPHVLGDIFLVEAARVGIAEHRCRAVVARHNHKTVVAFGVEHVVVRLICSPCRLAWYLMGRG